MSLCRIAVALPMGLFILMMRIIHFGYAIIYGDVSPSLRLAKNLGTQNEEKQTLEKTLWWLRTMKGRLQRQRRSHASRPVAFFVNAQFVYDQKADLLVVLAA